MNRDEVLGRLRGRRGRALWRTLEELSGAPEFRELLSREFPRGAEAWDDGLSRKDFIRLMAASLALAGLSSCAREPEEKIVPRERSPEDGVPGKPLFYATALAPDGYGLGVLVKSREGRPIKIEGNPEHPASLGATDAAAQALILELYDPDRSTSLTRGDRISTWNGFLGALDGALRLQKLRRGAGLRILTETVTSPSLAARLRRVLEAYPEARWHAFDPLGRDAARAGAKLAFGEELGCRWSFEAADVVLSLEADVLSWDPGRVRYGRELAARRSADRMNRVYALESTPTLTGAFADHRRAVRSGDIEGIARAAARAIEGNAALADPWLAAVVDDLKAHRGSGLVAAGPSQPPAVHALAHAMNERLGNAGRTAIYFDPVEESAAGGVESLRLLCEEMEAGRVELLVILGGNPVYTAPADLRFAERLAKVPQRVRLGLYHDETSRHCHWHVPEAHALEAWGDVKAFEGTVTIQQPLIAPLYGGRTPHELVSALLGETGTAGDVVKAHWSSRGEEFWRKSLHDGVVEGTASKVREPRVRAIPELASTGGGGLEAVFRPDPTVGDGRFANNAWLQELPKPLTTLTWDNAALVSPADAARLGLSNGDVVDLLLRGRRARAPVWILPGQAAGSVTLPLGYGRTRAGRVGTGAGFDAYALRCTEAPWASMGLELRKTGKRRALAVAQGHHAMEGRDLVRAETLEDFLREPAIFADEGKAPSLYEGPARDPDVAWGMTIDLGACTGCGACVTACQAENNIPTVGKAGVLRGREMHWIRVDRYFEGDPGAPDILHQPVPCMHCESAPCEPVCPVGATSHSREGLNEMTYNRCVGTRYCANNCPYKVRRFNFLDYVDAETPVLRLLRNPEVTVRARGVMEKCTYCVQRINAARAEAGKEGRPIRDGEAATACQQVCPASAIVFGNLKDPSSRVAKAKADPRNYALLAGLNTRPRTTYLGKLRNPNPAIKES